MKNLFVGPIFRPFNLLDLKTSTTYNLLRIYNIILLFLNDKQ